MPPSGPTPFAPGMAASMALRASAEALSDAAAAALAEAGSSAGVLPTGPLAALPPAGTAGGSRRVALFGSVVFGSVVFGSVVFGRAGAASPPPKALATDRSAV